MGEGQKAGRVMGATTEPPMRRGEAVADFPTTIGNFFGDNLLRPAFRANEKYVQPAMKQASQIPTNLKKWIDYQLNQRVKNYKPPINAGNEIWDAYRKDTIQKQEKVGDQIRQ